MDYYFWARPCSSLHTCICIVLPLSGQLDEVVVGHFTVSGDDDQLCQLAFDCRMFLDYLQGYQMSENLNRILIQLLGGQGQRSDVFLAPPVGDQFATDDSLSSTNRTDAGIAAMLISPLSRRLGRPPSAICAEPASWPRKLRLSRD